MQDLAFYSVFNVLYPLYTHSGFLSTLLFFCLFFPYFALFHIQKPAIHLLSRFLHYSRNFCLIKPFFHIFLHFHDRFHVYWSARSFHAIIIYRLGLIVNLSTFYPLLAKHEPLRLSEEFSHFDDLSLHNDEAL